MRSSNAQPCVPSTLGLRPTAPSLGSISGVGLCSESSKGPPVPKRPPHLMHGNNNSVFEVPVDSSELSQVDIDEARNVRYSAAPTRSTPESEVTETEARPTAEDDEEHIYDVIVSDENAYLEMI